VRLWAKTLRVGNFGGLRDKSLPPLGPGLNVVYGPNEAGKTTLLFFLRSMFFGFDRQPPTLDGGEPGGVLVLADDQGQEYVLERWGRGKKARVTLSGPAGAVSGEAGLRALLHHVSRPVYGNVFAFSLSELSDLKSLDHQEVKEFLYSASLGLGSLSLAKVESDLQKEAEALFKPGSRAQKLPEINQILAELAQIRHKLAELEKQPEEYQALLAELAGKDQEIEEITHRRQVAEAQRRRLVQLDQAWPVWENWQEVQVDLEALPLVTTFPEHGLARFERLAEERDRRSAELENTQRALRLAQQSLQGLAPDPRLLARAAAIEALWEKRLLFEDRREELVRQEQELAAARARLAESLANLGAGWDEERLERFPWSLSWRQEVREHNQRLEESRQALSQAETSYQHQAGISRERERAWEQAKAMGVAGEAGWLARWGLFLLGGILIGAAGVLAILEIEQYAAWAGSGAGAILLLALVFRLHLRALYRRRLTALAGDLSQATETLSKVQAEREKAQQDWEQRVAAWQAHLAAVGFPAGLSPPDALELAQEAERARRHLYTCRELEQVRDTASRFLEEFTSGVQAVCHGLELGEVPRAEVSATLARLKQDLVQSQEAQARKNLLDAEIATLTEKAAGEEVALMRVDAAIQDLFQAAGVDSVEAFRQRAENYQRREDLLSQSRHLLVQLRLLAGGDAAWEEFQQALKQTTRTDLKAGLERAVQEVALLDARLAQTQEAKGRLKARRDELEQAEEWGQTLLAEQTLAARLRELAQRWLVLTLSRHFLEQGRRRFEAESQPLVLQEASRYFTMLTEARYIKVMAPLEDEKLLVISHQGRHVPVDRLSRGTVEQLYLALRLALIRAYHQKGINLPLVLDDTLVNFDHHRARQAIRILQEMSATHQLLLFTCHPHILSLVAGTLGPAAPPVINFEGIF